MDGTYGNPLGRHQTPLSPQAPSTGNYQVNVSRSKTRKWVEAKTQNYDGDDWGADEFEEDEEEPEPAPFVPQVLSTQRMEPTGRQTPPTQGYGALPSSSSAFGELPSLRVQTQSPPTSTTPPVQSKPPGAFPSGPSEPVAYDQIVSPQPGPGVQQHQASESLQSSRFADPAPKPQPIPEPAGGVSLIAPPSIDIAARRDVGQASATPAKPLAGQDRRDSWERDDDESPHPEKEGSDNKLSHKHSDSRQDDWFRYSTVPEPETIPDEPNRGRLSTSPKLPDLARVSMFGSDFFSTPSGGDSNNAASETPDASAKSVVAPAQTEIVAEHTSPAIPSSQQPSALPSAQMGSHSQQGNPSEALGIFGADKDISPFNAAPTDQTRAISPKHDSEQVRVQQPSSDGQGGFGNLLTTNVTEEVSLNASGGLQPRSNRFSVPPLRTPSPHEPRNAVVASTSESVNITPTEPLQPRKPEESPTDFIAPPVHREATFDSITSSPLKESDVLSDEIMRSLSPRADGPTEFKPGEDQLLPPKNTKPVRESSYTLKDYDSYWEDTIEKPESPTKVDAPQPPQVNSALASTTSPVATPVIAAPIASQPSPAARASPVQQSGSEEVLSPQDSSSRRRFSWEGEEAAAVPLPQNSSSSGTPPTESRVATPTINVVAGPEHAAPNKGQENNNPVHQSQASDVHELDAGHTGLSHQVSKASTAPVMRDQLSAPHSPSPISTSVTSEKGSIATRDPNRLSLADEKELAVQTSRSLVSPTPPPENHPALFAPPSGAISIEQASATSVQTQLTNFRDIMNMPTYSERISKYNETRLAYAAMDSGLDSWLVSLNAEHPEHGFTEGVPYDTSAQRPTQSGNVTSGGPGAPGPGQQPYYQQYLNANSPGNAPSPAQAPAGRSRLGGLPVPSPISASAFGHSSNQIGTKGKEFMHSAGKMGKGLLSKGKSKLRASGDKGEQSTPPPVQQQRSLSKSERRTSWGLGLGLKSKDDGPAPHDDDTNDEMADPKPAPPPQLPEQTSMSQFDPVPQSEPGPADRRKKVRCSAAAPASVELDNTGNSMEKGPSPPGSPRRPTSDERPGSEHGGASILPPPSPPSNTVGLHREETEKYLAQHQSPTRVVGEKQPGGDWAVVSREPRSIQPQIVTMASSTQKAPVGPVAEDSGVGLSSQPHSQPQATTSDMPKRNSSFIGLPPIRRSSTFGLTSKARRATERFSLDDDSDEPPAGSAAHADPDPAQVSPEMEHAVLSPAPLPPTAALPPAPMPPARMPHAPMPPAAMYHASLPHAPVPPVAMHHTPMPYAPMPPTDGFTNESNVDTLVGARDSLSYKSGASFWQQEAFQGRLKLEGPPPSHQSPIHNPKRQSWGTQPVPPAVQPTNQPSNQPVMSNPIQRLPPGGAWKLEESHLSEPLHEVTRKRSGANNLNQEFMYGFDKETGLPSPMAAVTPPQQVPVRQRPDVPPSSAQRYPELFAQPPMQDPNRWVRGPPPPNQSQPNVPPDEMMVPRAQWNEYDLPGVGPPVGAEERGRSRRNSGIFKDIGARIARATSRERRNSRPPSGRPASANFNGDEASETNVAIEETHERKKKRASFMGLSSRRSSMDQGAQRRETFGGLRHSQTDLIATGTPPHSSGERKRSFFGAAQHKLIPGGLNRASTSSLVLDSNHSAVGSEHTGRSTPQKKRLSSIAKMPGITGLFNRAKQEQHSDQGSQTPTAHSPAAGGQSDAAGMDMSDLEPPRRGRSGTASSTDMVRPQSGRDERSSRRSRQGSAMGFVSGMFGARSSSKSREQAPAPSFPAQSVHNQLDGSVPSPPPNAHRHSQLQRAATPPPAPTPGLGRARSSSFEAAHSPPALVSVRQVSQPIGQQTRPSPLGQGAPMTTIELPPQIPLDWAPQRSLQSSPALDRPPSSVERFMTPPEHPSSPAVWPTASPQLQSSSLRHSVGEPPAIVRQDSVTEEVELLRSSTVSPALSVTSGMDDVHRPVSHIQVEASDEPRRGDLGIMQGQQSAASIASARSSQRNLPLSKPSSPPRSFRSISSQKEELNVSMPRHEINASPKPLTSTSPLPRHVASSPDQSLVTESPLPLRIPSQLQSGGATPTERPHSDVLPRLQQQASMITPTQTPHSDVLPRSQQQATSISPSQTPHGDVPQKLQQHAATGTPTQIQSDFPPPVQQHVATATPTQTQSGFPPPVQQRTSPHPPVQVSHSGFPPRLQHPGTTTTPMQAPQSNFVSNAQTQPQGYRQPGMVGFQQPVYQEQQPVNSQMAANRQGQPNQMYMQNVGQPPMPAPYSPASQGPYPGSIHGSDGGRPVIRLDKNSKGEGQGSRWKGLKNRMNEQMAQISQQPNHQRPEKKEREKEKDKLSAGKILGAFKRGTKQPGHSPNQTNAQPAQQRPYSQQSSQMQWQQTPPPQGNPNPVGQPLPPMAQPPNMRMQAAPLPYQMPQDPGQNMGGQTPIPQGQFGSSNYIEQTYEAVPIPQGYSAVHGDGMVVPSPYNLGRSTPQSQFPFQQQRQQPYMAQQSYGHQHPTVNAGAYHQESVPHPRVQSQNTGFSMSSQASRASHVSGLSDSSQAYPASRVLNTEIPGANSPRQDALPLRSIRSSISESQYTGGDRHTPTNSVRGSQHMAVAEQSPKASAIYARESPIEDQRSASLSPDVIQVRDQNSSSSSEKQGKRTANLDVDVKKAQQPTEEDDIYDATPRVVQNDTGESAASPKPLQLVTGTSTKGSMGGSTAKERSPVELEDTEEARKRAIRLDSQEEKIFYDKDDFEPQMSATSYPGQEWNPYGDAEGGEGEDR